MLIGAIFVMAAGIIERNWPVRVYISGYREYKSALALSSEGKSRAAGKRFQKAIDEMKPLLKQRNTIDHRDVINCILISAMCEENLGNDSQAIDRYRLILKEYPYSRYTGEGRVKIARIHQSRGKRHWLDARKKMGREPLITVEQLFHESLKDFEKSVKNYRRAIGESPFSHWSDYARTDLKNLSNFLRTMGKDINPFPELQRFKNRIARLEEKIKKLMAEKNYL